MVVEELGEEIDAQIRAMPIERQISEMMEVKKDLESNYVHLHTQSIDEGSTKYQEELQELQAQISRVDAQLTKLIKEQQAFFNPKWERIFRAGAEESYFAYQVDRFACIYMEKLSDLLECSPITYFRANRRLLAHDLET